MTDTLTREATPGSGRTRITARALDRVVSAVASDELGIPARGVHVELLDDGGPLTLVVSSPMRVVSLSAVMNRPAVVGATGGGLMTRAATAQENIRNRVRELTGSDISRIRLHITGVDVAPQKRVS